MHIPAIPKVHISQQKSIIKKLSPSKFLTFRNGCIYRELLLRSNHERRDLFLPFSSSTYVGRIVHRMYELAIRGIISSEADFISSWRDETSKMESYLLAENPSFSILVPLVDFVKMKHTQKAVMNILSFKGKKKEEAASLISPEKYFNSVDFIEGRIDLIIESNGYIEIVDYKTGDIFNDTGKEIKDDYVIQLKLYVILYQKSTGKIVTRLGIINLLGEKIDIPFTQEEIGKLYEEAREIILDVNHKTRNLNYDSLVKCTEQECKYCVCKPICSYYWNSDLFFKNNILKGTLVEVKKGMNGKVYVEIMFGGKFLFLSNLTSYSYDDLIIWKNKEIRIFNILRNRVYSGYFSATKNTLIYGVE